jgi:hypothetical protein
MPSKLISMNHSLEEVNNAQVDINKTSFQNATQTALDFKMH